MKRCVVWAALIGLLAVFPSAGHAQHALVISANMIHRLAERESIPLAPVVACGWSPDGRQIAAATTDGVYTISQVLPGSSPALLGGVVQLATDLTYLPGSSALALADSQSMWVWDQDANAERLRMAGSAPIAASADGALLALTDGGAVARVVRVSDGRTQAEMVGHEGRITDLDFAPTGQYLASSSRDFTLRLWNASSGAQMRFQRSRRRAQLALDVNRYSASVASGAEGGIARLLNVAITTESLYNLRPRADIVAVAYSPDSLVLALVGGPNLFLWTLTDREPAVVYSLSAPANCLAFHPDGLRLLVGTADGLHIFAPAA